MILDELRRHWDLRVHTLIERWKDTELELITIERWQAERRAFYTEIKEEMERCGNDFFLPPSLKLLVQIKTPADRRLEERWEAGWTYCQEMAGLNEVKKVLAGLRKLDLISRVMRGPYGFVIYGLEDGGFIVDVPEVPKEKRT